MKWAHKIELLKVLLKHTGKLWTGTELAGYGEDGPYHCDDCIFLKGRVDGKIVRDENGKGYCNQPVMMADPKVTHREDGTAVVNIKKGCCEYVNPEGLKKLDALK